MSNYRAMYISAIIWQKNNMGEWGVILNLHWSSLVNFSNFPTDKYKLNKRWNLTLLQRWNPTLFQRWNLTLFQRCKRLNLTLIRRWNLTLCQCWNLTLKQGRKWVVFPTLKSITLFQRWKLVVQLRNLKSTLKQRWNNVVCRLGGAVVSSPSADPRWLNSDVSNTFSYLCGD